MKLISAKTILGLSALLLTAACTDEQVENPADGARPIAFTPAAETRAAVDGTTLPANSSFKVWGWYDTDKNVFNGNTVTNTSGAWTYDGVTQYWIKGKMYNFYGVYPANVTASVDPNGTITVTGFDCSATGTNAVDLMTATATGLSGDDAPTVAMKFGHLLAKIEFVGKSEGGNATVNKLVLSSISTQGTYVSSSVSLWSNLESRDITIDSSTDLTPDGVSVSGDMLLIPQTLTAPQLTVTYSTDTETGRTETYTLPVDVVSSWVAGQSYRYTFTVTGGGYIIFDVPTVNKWGSATGGNITIDVTEPNS